MLQAFWKPPGFLHFGKPQFTVLFLELGLQTTVETYQYSFSATVPQSHFCPPSMYVLKLTHTALRFELTTPHLHSDSSLTSCGWGASDSVAFRDLSFPNPQEHEWFL